MRNVHTAIVVLPLACHRRRSGQSIPIPSTPPHTPKLRSTTSVGPRSAAASITSGHDHPIARQNGQRGRHIDASSSAPAWVLDEHLKSEDFQRGETDHHLQGCKIAFNGTRPRPCLGDHHSGRDQARHFDHHPFRMQSPDAQERRLWAEASTTIKRSEFGMTKYVPALGDDVKLLINVEAFKD